MHPWMRLQYNSILSKYAIIHSGQKDRTRFKFVESKYASILVPKDHKLWLELADVVENL